MSSSADTIADLMKESLLRNSLADHLQNFNINDESKTSEISSLLNKQSKAVSSVLNKDTLQDLIDGKYEISLKDYTSLSTYNIAMSNLLGNNSANPFQSALNNVLGVNEDSLANAKTFIETLKERGVSNSSAIKMYSAIQSYSVMNNLYNLNNSSYVNAKI